ncbi:Uncharacterised protein [Bacillus subtilis]|nr:hypothetical protein S101392_02757 [Bacillus subtilis subsp. subtilis]CJS45561.1 Uncharacterised protein [Streptococcus pneumoniae]CON37258.1 Uncharacterised protein [Bacillus subtilis]
MVVRLDIDGALHLALNHLSSHQKTDTKQISVNAASSVSATYYDFCFLLPGRIKMIRYVIKRYIL